MSPAPTVTYATVLRALPHGALIVVKHNLGGAGAATVAAAYQQHKRFRGEKVMAELSGGNLDLAQLPSILAQLRGV